MDSEWILIGPLNNHEQKFRLKEGINKIGRGINNDIRILQPQVSREHCTITIEKYKITLLDVGSSNGCYVGKNKIPAKQAWHISSGDKIGFGIETDTELSDLIFQIIRKKITTNEINGNYQVQDLENVDDLLSSDDSDVLVIYPPKTSSNIDAKNKSDTTQKIPPTSKTDKHVTKSCSVSNIDAKNKSDTTQKIPSTSKTDKHVTKSCSVSNIDAKNKSDTTQKIPSTSKTDKHVTKTCSVSNIDTKNNSNSTQKIPSTSKTDKHVTKSCSVSNIDAKNKSDITQKIPSTSKTDKHATKSCSVSNIDAKNKSDTTQKIPSTSKTDKHVTKSCSVYNIDAKNKSDTTQKIPSTSKTDKHVTKTCSVSNIDTKNNSNSTQKIPSTSKTDKHVTKSCSVSKIDAKNNSNSTLEIPSTSKSDVKHDIKPCSVSLYNIDAIIESNSTKNSTSKSDIEHVSKNLNLTNPIDCSIIKTEYTDSSDFIEIDDSDEEISLSQYFSVSSIKNEIKQEYIELIIDDDDDLFSRVFSQELSFNDNQNNRFYEFSSHQNPLISKNQKNPEINFFCKRSIKDTESTAILISEDEEDPEINDKDRFCKGSKDTKSAYISEDEDPEINDQKNHEINTFCKRSIKDTESAILISDDEEKPEINDKDRFCKVSKDPKSADISEDKKNPEINDKNMFFKHSKNQNPEINKFCKRLKKDTISTDYLISEDEEDPENDKDRFCKVSKDPKNADISEDKKNPEINDKKMFFKHSKNQNPEINKFCKRLKKDTISTDYVISEDEEDPENDKDRLVLINKETESIKIVPEKPEILNDKDLVNTSKLLGIKKKNDESTKMILIEPQNLKKKVKKKKKEPFCTKAEKLKVVESRREKLKEIASKNQSLKMTQIEKKIPPIKIIRNSSRSEFLSKENYQIKKIDKTTQDVKKRKIDEELNNENKKTKIDEELNKKTKIDEELNNENKKTKIDEELNKKTKIDEELNNENKKRKIDEELNKKTKIDEEFKIKKVTFSKQLLEIFEIPACGKMKKVNRQKEFTTKEPHNLEPTKINWAYEITHSPVVHIMCKWSVNWLHECKTILKDPPLLNYPPLRVEDKYNSYDLYKFSMYPLLMSEIWSDIVREKDLQDLNEKSFGVLHGVIEHSSNLNWSGKNIILCRCLMVGEAAIFKNNLTPKYADLSIVQINFPNESKKFVYNAFSVVYNSPKFMHIKQCKDIKFLNFLKSSLQLKNENSTIEPSGYCCVDLVLHPSSNGPGIENGFFIKLRTVKNISKDLRLTKTIFNIETSSLRQIIINPTEYLPVPELSHKDKLITKLKLNEAQEKAVLCISRSILSKKPSINLIHGPPGTGKTHVIIALIQQILYHTRDNNKRKKMPKILLCTPSNSALDEIVLRLMDIRKSLPDNKFKLIRCGNPDTMHISVRNISPQFLAQNKVNMDLDQSNVEIELNLLRAKESAYKLACESKTDGRCVEKLSSIQEKIIEFEKFANNKCPQNNYLRNKMLIDEENSVIGNAEIIATTLSSCYSKKIVDALSDSKDISFSCCIVDEATQAIEPEVLMPLLHKIENVVLVGDPCQLPATVCSQTSKNFSFDTSIYHRLYNCWKNNENAPLYRLQDQYRMHSEIADFPSKHFYDGFLKTPFSDGKYPFMPYIVIEHKFLQDSQGEINQNEGKLILEMMYALGSKSIFDKMNLGIIVPYQKQKTYINSLLKKGEKPKINLMLNTIDSFQGKEKDIVIVSCVRTDGIGFLADKQRINVALTRAKKCLLIVGNFSCLQKNDTWKSLILDAKSRNVYYSLESQNIRDSVKSLIKHITRIK